MSRLPLSVLAGLALLVSVLVALPTPAQAATVHKKAPTSSVSRPIPGESFSLSGTLGRSVKRYAVLQRKSGSRWVRVQRTIIPASGAYRFALTQPTYVASWRVIARKVKVKRHTYAQRLSNTRTLTRISQTASVSAPAAIKAGSAATVTASFSPVRRGRTAQIQINTGAGWKTIATGAQGPAGRVTTSWRSTTNTTVQFRAIAAARAGVGSLTTAARTVAVLPSTPVAISAHRGYSSKFAENSWHAFNGAMQEKAEWIETDFRLSAPNPTDVLAIADPDQPDLPVDPTCAGPAGTRFWVIVHDSTFARTTDVGSVFPGRANDATTTFTCSEIKQLRVDTLRSPNLSELGVPTLAEFVTWMRAFEVKTGYSGERIMVEYKGSKASEFADLYDQVKALAPEWIDASTHHDKAVFTSFNYTSAFTALLDPQYGVGGDVTSNERVFDGAELAAIIDSTSDKLPSQPSDVSTRWLQVQYQHTLLTAARAKAAHAIVEQVVAWTPVASTSIQKAAALGADVITTDNLPAARAALLR
ncbi:glycerophosphodiester phosphodiesterase family protein [Nocardioides sp.]|uniref:glycerophosphodiester phosphodiesterase n=1 Tax=Nocardioides sp. TaxID=35761 RepID=UPI00263A2728|nr:glycerophosphodiester phosphodiesterase family protein [Nocardioides sp.]